MSTMNTEESFVLASLTEFVKLWGSGTQASFNLECRNGQAWFKLSSLLGPPNHPHFTPLHEVAMVSMVMKINTHLREREDLNKFSAIEHVQKPTAPP